MARVALITCRELPEPDFDEEILLDALRGAGHDAVLAAWDEPDATVASFDLALLRSCWNYYEDPGRFLAWIDNASRESRLVNRAEAVRWNLHKRYLSELEKRGVGIVPTAWFARGDRADLGELMERKGWREVVIKPAVAAASFLARRFGAGESDRGGAYLASRLRERDMMVQRYMPVVEKGGETALVWIDGLFTHGVRKMPRFAGGVEEVSAATAPSAEERAAGEAAMAAAGGGLLYGRVDLMADAESGRLLVSELELIEPSLFFQQHPPALARFVGAVGRWAAGGDR